MIRRRAGIRQAGSSFTFEMLGLSVRVDCEDDAVAGALDANFGTMAMAPPAAPPDVRYAISGPHPRGFYLLHRRGRAAAKAHDLGDLLFDLEKDLCIELQTRRPHLLFLHAAALEHRGRAYLLVGESGHGKSTMAWGLLHHGFRYLSDELSPVELESLSVLPYAHALCVKQPPPRAYPLPSRQVLDLGRTLHVPVGALPSKATLAPCKLAGVFFLRHHPGLQEPGLRTLRPAEAAARLYVSTLNALAHRHQGLDAVVGVAGRVPCWALDAGDLARTCDLVHHVVTVGLQGAGREPHGPVAR